MYIEKLLADITRMFESINIPYLLTGSLAYNIYALPRATRDIELHKRDIETLLLNPDVDKEYIKNWCKNLNLKPYNLI